MDETNNVNKVHSALTKEQFDALTEYDENTFYPVIDETGVDSIGGATGDILLGTNLSMTGNTLNASSSTEYMHHIFLRVNEAQSQAIMTFELRNKNSTVLSTLPLLANALAEQGFRQGNYFRYHTIAGIDTDNNIIINGIGSAIDLGTSFENYVKIKGVKINFTGANISDFETTVKSAFVLEDVVTEL